MSTKDMKVTALPGDQRPEDALKYLAEACDAGALGVIVAIVRESGDVEPRAFGDVRVGHVASAGAQLTTRAARAADEAASRRERRGR